MTMIPFVILAIENEDDQNFMAEVYVKYERLMLSRIRKVIKTAPCDAEDILQNLLVSLIRNVDKLQKMDERSMVNYIITAAQNTARDALRKLYHAENRSFDDETWFERDKFISEDDTMETVFRREDMRQLEEALNRLSERNAYLIRGKYILELDNYELSRQLGLKYDSVRMELSRARKKLKAILDELSSAVNV